MQAEKWTSSLAQVTDAVQYMFGPLSTEELNWKPAPSVWSIAQNIDHLIVINQTYFPILTALREGTYQPPRLDRFGFLASWLGKVILKGVQPDRKRKMKTFPIWEPAQSELSADILARFEKHQIALSRKIEEAMGSVEQGVVISSPANKNIIYRLDTAFDIMVAHEQRHVEQAKEVLSRLRQNRQPSS